VCFSGLPSIDAFSGYLQRSFTHLPLSIDMLCIPCLLLVGFIFTIIRNSLRKLLYEPRDLDQCLDEEFPGWHSEYLKTKVLFTSKNGTNGLVKVCRRVFNAIFNNISVICWWAVLLVEETEVPGEKQRPVVNHWQTLSYNVVSSTPRHERD
jgi:hypothetical protein